MVVIDSMTDYSLSFLRPAPPKMSVRPLHVKEHLFSKYKSKLPPEEYEYGRFASGEHRSRSSKRLKFMVSQNGCRAMRMAHESRLTVDSEGDMDEDDLDEGDDPEGLVILEK